MAKSNDGIFYKRGDDRRLLYYWRIGKVKSRDFNCQIECAKEYIENYISRYPKYKELVYDKTWEQIFSIFGIKINQVNQIPGRGLR